MDKALSKKKWIILFLTPALLLYTFTVFVPIIWSSVYSLFSWNGISAMKFAGLSNYSKLFSDSYFIQSFKNNLVFVVINVIGQLFVGAFVAVLLCYITKGRELLKTLYFAPVVLSCVAVAKIWSKFYGIDPDGVVNAILGFLHLGELRRAWIGNMDTALVGVSVIECYWHMGLFMAIIYSGLISVSNDVIESATLDGASVWKIFWKIRLPLIVDVLTIAFVMCINGCLKAFDVTFLATSGGPGHATELVATYMYKTAFTSAKYGYGSAVAMFLVIESIVAVALIRKVGDMANKIMD